MFAQRKILLIHTKISCIWRFIPSFKCDKMWEEIADKKKWPLV